MAPLVLPLPVLTLDEAKALEQVLLEKDPAVFANVKKEAFSGLALKEFVEKLGVAPYEGKSAEKIGAALLEHRLMHNVNDDADFDVQGKYRLISQESYEVQALHLAFSTFIQNAKFQGKILWKHSFFFGMVERYIPVYATMDDSKLRLFKSQSAASAPIAEYLVNKMTEMKECNNCKQDWYCFDIKFRSGESITLCADHSKRQEGWMVTLSSLGVNLKKIQEVGDEEIEKVNSIYELSARRLNSQEIVPFSAYKGKVCMVVNVSTLCGLTPQYADLQKLHEKYSSKGLVIIGFPVNQFGNQEPGKEDEIAQFAKTKFGVQFEMMEKTECNGPHAHPVFRFVKARLNGVMGNSVKWNFTKFVCDRNGLPVRRYAPTTTPLSFEDDIVELLNQSAKSN
jgi:glutathione peroxidase